MNMDQQIEAYLADLTSGKVEVPKAKILLIRAATHNRFEQAVAIAAALTMFMEKNRWKP